MTFTVPYKENIIGLAPSLVKKENVEEQMGKGKQGDRLHICNTACRFGLNIWHDQAASGLVTTCLPTDFTYN